MKKIASGATTYYIWEGGQVLAEHNGAGGNLVDYVYAGGKMIAKVASGSTQYFVSDRLSVRMTVDSSGNVVGRQGHLPFGEDFAETGAQEKHHFTSYERDSESGLDYALNRGYSPAVGRFQSADSYRASGYLVDPQSWNRYSYVRNNPVSRVDRLGLDDNPPDDGGESDPVVLTVTEDSYAVPPAWENGFNIAPLLDSSLYPQPQQRRPPVTPQIPNINPGPHILFGRYKNLIQAFKDAFDNAEKRLDKKGCAKLFGGKQNALSVLYGADYRLGDEGVRSSFKDGKFAYSLTGAWTNGNTVTLNMSGPFFNDPRVEVSGNNFQTFDFGTGLTGADLAALLLLHELGHLTGKWGKDAGIGDKDKNLEHTQDVYKNCF